MMCRVPEDCALSFARGTAPGLVSTKDMTHLQI
jgi:hypothetical protein